MKKNEWILCPVCKCVSCERARRKDAEPIIRRYKRGFPALFYWIVLKGMNKHEDLLFYSNR